MPGATISTVPGYGFVPRFPNAARRLAQLLFRVVASACALGVCVELSESTAGDVAFFSGCSGARITLSPAARAGFNTSV